MKTTIESDKDKGQLIDAQPIFIIKDGADLDQICKDISSQIIDASRRDPHYLVRK
ncbi:hypothetical protein ACU1JV_26600 [Paenibacillus sp. T2-29]